MGQETDEHLKNQGASASTGGVNNIMISSWATKSAVEEELYHVIQLKRMNLESLDQLSLLDHANVEIEAQIYLLKNAKRMKLSYNEVEELKRNLSHWRKRKRKLES